ncbi:hypothetical protein LEP1GSC036_2837 [Leptospira weilii str. 2006001853]|uniref:Uncharacterized protein n=1 Tax=Leptospira weilii str. 2006001853 TaxID=1001589 RepID=A0A828Z382_9LEPT|nr:hypothetical protein LEP1GSC036_2837 [Leptospira weilii str. 2006001853]
MSEFRRIYLRIQVLVGKVMAPYGALITPPPKIRGKLRHNAS